MKNSKQVMVDMVQLHRWQKIVTAVEKAGAPTRGKKRTASSDVAEALNVAIAFCEGRLKAKPMEDDAPRIIIPGRLNND